MNFDPAPFLFLRPAWLFLLPLVPLCAWLVLRQRGQAGIWERYVDPELQPAVLEPAASSRGWGAALWGSVMMTLVLLALAGPSVRQSEQPLWDRNDPLVVVMDLSTDMLRDDVAPSRLELGSAKLRGLLKDWAGDVGMVVYADQPFTISPMTEDPANVEVYLDQLSPDIMPRNGRNLAMALDYASQLAQRDGQVGGTLLVLTGDADTAAADAAAKASARGFTVSVMGLGTAATLNESALQAVASAGGGRYARVDPAGQSDWDHLRPEKSAGSRLAQGLQTVRNGYVRQDNGFWLLPFILLLAPLAFRRRQLALNVPLLGALLAGAMYLNPTAAQAQVAPAPAPRATWWSTMEQSQARLAQAGDDAYAAGRYAEAASAYAGVPGAQARYNQANALAKSGQLKPAIEQYRQALAADPANRDAKINKAIVEAALKAQLNAFDKPKAPQTKQGQSQKDADRLRKQQEALRKQREAEAKARAERAKEKAKQMQKRDDHINPLTGKPYTAKEQQSREDLRKRLAQVKDDPGGLLRAKFYLEYLRRLQAQGDL